MFVKQKAIETLINAYANKGAWLSACQKDASAYLTKEERPRLKELYALCEQIYATKGIDSRGRKS